MSVFKKNDIMVSREGGMMNLGKTINDLRKKNNMTQEELAALLGVSPQAVSKWENDLSCPDISLLPDLVKIFGITVDDLLNGNRDDGRKAADTIPENSSSNKRAKKINISVDNNHGKATNVSIPIRLVNFGLNIGSAIGGLTGEHSKIVMDAIENGLSGEILHVNGENGEIITISLE